MFWPSPTFASSPGVNAGAASDSSVAQGLNEPGNAAEKMAYLFLGYDAVVEARCDFALGRIEDRFPLSNLAERLRHPLLFRRAKTLASTSASAKSRIASLTGLPE